MTQSTSILSAVIIPPNSQAIHTSYKSPGSSRQTLFDFATLASRASHGIPSFPIAVAFNFEEGPFRAELFLLCCPLSYPKYKVQDAWCEQSHVQDYSLYLLTMLVTVVSGSSSSSKASCIWEHATKQTMSMIPSNWSKEAPNTDDIWPQLSYNPSLSFFISFSLHTISCGYLTSSSPI